MHGTIKIEAHLTIIKWDTDGKKIAGLPKKYKTELEVTDDSLSSIHEQAMDNATNDHGWCIDSCTLDKVVLL
jgi:hypothetical protein